jgi:hypothetical protein
MIERSSERCSTWIGKEFERSLNDRGISILNKSAGLAMESDRKRAGKSWKKGGFGEGWLRIEMEFCSRRNSWKLEESILGLLRS